MAVALVAHTASSASTTGSINTTGADFLGVVVSDFGGSIPNGAISDNKGNLWTVVATAFQPSGQQCTLAVSYPTSVGSGHTFTVSGGNVPAIAVCAFSGLTPQVGIATAASTNTAQPGTITLDQSVALLLSAVAFNVVGATVSVTGGFTISNQLTTGSREGIGMAYLITATGTITPTWTVTGSSSQVSAVMAAFNQSGGGGGGGTGAVYGSS